MARIIINVPLWLRHQVECHAKLENRTLNEIAERALHDALGALNPVRVSPIKQYYAVELLNEDGMYEERCRFVLESDANTRARLLREGLIRLSILKKAKAS